MSKREKKEIEPQVIQVDRVEFSEFWALITCEKLKAYKISTSFIRASEEVKGKPKRVKQ